MLPRLLIFVTAVAAIATQPPAPRSINMYEGYAELPGVRLWYRDSGGSGVPVVFLHAATGSSRVWEHQEHAFVAAGYRFIAYDRRGFGRTIVEASATPSSAVPADADD